MTDDATLFDTTAPVAGGPDEPPARKPATVFVLSNRYNLLEFLSVGLIIPSSAFGKYYVDLLERAPGRIVVLRGTADKSLVDVVSSEDPTAFPVALEIDPARLTLEHSPVLPASAAGTLADASALVWAPAGAIPLSAVSAVHFRSASELSEHEAREYENVRPFGLLTVSPELFTGGPVTLQELGPFLESLPPVSNVSEALEKADRVAGSRLAAIAAAPSDAEILRELFRMFGSNKGPAASKSSLPPFLSCAIGVAVPTADADPDWALFASAVTVLSSIDRSASWRPTEILKQVREVVDGLDLNPEGRELVERGLASIQAIIRNEREFQPFTRSGLASMKALLLVMLRPDLESLLAWPRAETGADLDVMICAASLAGALRGRKRMPLELRPEGLDQLLAGLISSGLKAIDPSVPLTPKLGKITVDDQESQVVVLVNGDVLLTKVKPPPSLPERLGRLDLTEPAARAAAIDLCRFAGWTDCLVTVVRGERFVVTTEVKSAAITVRFDGEAEVTTELDVERLHQHAQVAPDFKPPEDLVRRFAALRTSTSGDRKRDSASPRR